MKTFQQFVTEVYDRSFDTATRQQGEGGRVRASRKKSEVEKKRTKVVGGKRVTVDGKEKIVGGKRVTVNYKDRKDIGKQRPRSEREQQPTRERGSAALSPKEAQKKAYLERKAREKGAKTKSASELLSKKTTKAVDPKYTPPKASGLSKAEQQSLKRKGEKKLRDLRLQNLGKKSEKELKHKITSK